MNQSCRLSWIVLALAVLTIPPALADEYLVYNDGGIPARTDVWTWCDAGQPCDVSGFQSCATPEGSVSLRVNTNLWGGWGVFYLDENGDNTLREDLSAFVDGEIRFFVKAAYNVSVEFQCQQLPGRTTTIEAHGWDGTNTWQEIVIPVAAFGAEPVSAECLREVNGAFMATIADLPFFNSFQIDNVRWRTANSHSGAPSVEVQERQLMVDGEPFVVNGMAYSPISIGEDFHGSFRDRPDRYLIDFPEIAASGANAVRIYSSFMTTAMLDAALAEGLYVIPTFQIDTVQLQCDAGRDFMRDRLQEMVLDHKDHPAILFWLIGNEVNDRGTCSETTQSCGADSECPDTETCNGAVRCGNATDWYSQLENLAKAAHIAEGGGTCSAAGTDCMKDNDCGGSETCEVAAGAQFRPVGTANKEVDDIGIADCSDDTTLTNVNLWGAQVYRGCRSLSGAFTEYEAKSTKPLIITEFGADAWDGRTEMENETMQANCFELMLADASQALAVRSPTGVSSGQVVFEWADEWWKAFVPNPEEPGFCSAADGIAWTTHDTCKNWEALGYSPDADTDMNEEWWGITGLDPNDPDGRVVREAHGAVGEAWSGSVCKEVDAHDSGTGNTNISFDPPTLAVDHSLYYGPLNAVSSYGYSGFVRELGTTGSATVTLPAGSLFWVVVAENENQQEGCYGKNSAGAERPCFPAPGDPGSCDIAEAANWAWTCRTCSSP